MPARTVTLCFCLVWCASAAFAQRVPRGYAHVDFGYGSMEDDEGGLGRGVALGGALGATIVDEVELEFSVTRMHHERSVAISWEGDVTTYVARVVYRSGGAGSSVRWFAGAGGGYYSYGGTISETTFPSASSGPVVDRFDYSFSGLVYETGGGLEFAAGGKAFVRPELWATIPRGERTAGGRTPEPPFLVIRGAVVAGLRF